MLKFKIQVKSFHMNSNRLLIFNVDFLGGFTDQGKREQDLLELLQGNRRY